MSDKPLFDASTPTSVRLNDAIGFVTEYDGPYRLQDLCDEVEAKERRIEALDKAIAQALDLDNRSSTEEGHKRDMVRAMGILRDALAAERKTP
jgi:hypothetical protein